MSWFGWSVMTVIFWGLWGFLAKVALQALTWPQVLFFGAVASVALSTLVVVLVRPPLAVPPEPALPAVAASLLGTLGTITLYLALSANGRASVVIPMTASYPVITAALSIMLLKEEPEPGKLLAIALFVVATVLAAR